MSAFLPDTKGRRWKPGWKRNCKRASPEESCRSTRQLRIAGGIAIEAKRKGKALSVIDGLLAATALHHNLTVVSRNARDFMGVQVQVLNPWEG